MDKYVTMVYMYIDDINIEKRIELLTEYLTPQRKAKMLEVLSFRTRFLSVVLEDIYQPHNASAVLRSCEAFGVQDIHIIEDKNTFTPNPEVTLGSSKWLSLQTYHQVATTEVYATLRKNGYRVVATTLSSSNPSTTLDQFNITTTPSAIVFGSELKGLSKSAIDNADETLYIPMFGFVESFNISVSAAIVLSYLVNQLHASTQQWQIPENDRKKILLYWLQSDVHKSQEIEQRFFKDTT